MAHESRKAIYVGIVATLLIAITKYAAAAVTGSSAMLAEGVHSTIDTADAALLLFGQHRASRPPDEEHPFGHGRELYFWSLIVSILFFALGGGVSIYEGITHMAHPEPITDVTWNYAVLAAALVFTAWSLVVAYRGFRKERGTRGFWETVRASKDPTLFTLVLEDGADVVGIVLAFVGILLGSILDNPYIDGAASIGVGLVMAGVAVILATESKGLLIGEQADPAVAAMVRRVAQESPAVRAVRRIVTSQLGPDRIFVAMGVEFHPRLTSAQIGAAIDQLDRTIKAADPDVAFVYVEAQALKQAEDVPG